jgi:molybdenum cofactor cytidylyltransferase
MAETIVPLVLAAGDSLRMQRPKALLDFGGRTAIELVLGASREAGLAPAVVVLGRDAEAIRPRLPAGTRVVVNPDPGRGRTSSIRAGLEAIEAAGAPADAFLLHPVDSPLVEAQTIARLVAESRDGAAIAVPVYEGRRGHPALFRRAVFAEFLALGDDEPAHRVVRRDPDRVREVPVEDEAVVRRLDTPEEYQAALAAWRAGR